MGIKFSVVGEALKSVLLDPPMDDAGICQNLRIELDCEELTDYQRSVLNHMSCNEFGITLNNAIFHSWPEHSGSENFPVGGPAEYFACRGDKWNDRPESGQKRRRLLMYSIQVCKENPDKELEL